MKVVFLKNLKAARKLRGYTIRGLAQQAGTTHANISWLENLRHGAEPKTLHAIAEALRVTPEELIGDGEAYDKMPKAAKSKGPGRPIGYTKWGEKIEKQITIHVTPTAYAWLKKQPRGWLVNEIEVLARSEESHTN